MAEKKTTESTENILGSLWYKFFPYWPLFFFLTGLFVALGIAYILYQKPAYIVSASLVITNEENNNRGYTNQPFQALNPFATTQVVDNEVLILQSRSLMEKVVKALHLYAAVWENRSASAYAAWLTAPVIVEAKDPEKCKNKEKAFFELDPVSNTVKIENKHYALNQWIHFPFGTIRFVRNPYQSQKTHRALYFSIEHPAIVAEQLIKKLKVASVSKLSTTINITYQTDVPELGEAIVNELLKQYVQSSIEHQNALATSTLDFASDRLRDVEKELDSIERKIQQFRTRTGAIDLTEQSRIYLQNVAETDRKVADIDAQLAALNQIAQYARGEGRRMGIVPTNLGIDDPVLAELLQRLNELELQLSNQRTTTGENNPVVESIQSEISKIRPSIQNIVVNQQSRLRASRNNLSGTTSRMNSTIRGIPAQERELLEISRQQAVKRDLYAFLLQRREEAALSNSSSIANNRVVDWADANVATRKSGRIIILLGCLFAGLALSLAYIIFKEDCSGKVLFRSNVEKQTNLPVISEITYHRQPKSPRTSALDNAILTKEFSQIQAALGLFNEGNTRKTLLVTSLLLNEGTSFVSRNLAIKLAATGKKVVLLDLNLLKTDTSRAFDVQQATGFSDFFQGNHDISHLLHKSKHANLDIMPAGNNSGNTVTLLMHPRVGELFASLKSRYDFLIIDAPPLELASDAYALSRFIDTTILVVRHGVTPKTTLKRLDENVEVKNIKDVHIVLNGIRARGFPRRYFGYGFGYGYERIPKKQLLKLAKQA